MRKIEEDPNFANRNDVDLIDLNKQLRINYSLKTFKMFLVLAQGLYFLSSIWYIYCDQILHIWSDEQDMEFFITTNGLKNN